MKNPLFSRRHYRAIAEELSKLVTFTTHGVNREFRKTLVDAFVNDMIAMFKADNPNFQPERFRKVVYDEQEKT